jgi:predicted nucleic acid-binding protein
VIVVDTNVIAYLWLPAPETPQAERLLQSDDTWCAPLLWRSEFRSVLVGCVRRGLLSLEAALRTAAEAEDHLRGHEYAVPGDRVLRAASASGCSAYDCEFVVLAEQLGVALVTADRQVLRAFPKIARALAQGAEE